MKRVNVRLGWASGILAALCGLGLAFPAHAQTPQAQAWTILQAGASDSSVEQRGNTMRVLQLIPGDAKAIGLAEKGLTDSDPLVRSAAALSLGAMKAKSSVPNLLAALKDPQGGVVLAAASALVDLGNEKGYSVFYAILTGQRKSGDSMVGGEEEQINELMKDPKQMTEMAFEHGIGYAPFGGVALGAFEAIHGSEEKEQIVKATAVRTLGKDPDPRSEKALVAATTDKSWLVRAAAFDALARRGDSKVLPQIVSGLTDDKDVVKLAAAATVVRLSTAEKAKAK